MSQENKMGVMPINKLLISMSLPMIIISLVQALYNIVDSVWTSMEIIIGRDMVTNSLLTGMVPILFSCDM